MVKCVSFTKILILIIVCQVVRWLKCMIGEKDNKCCIGIMKGTNNTRQGK